MLADRQCKLLTAYVDGELSTRDRQAADQLLASSPEARTFLQQLLSDSKELRNLPPHPSPPSLTQTVMDAVAETQALPKSLAPGPVATAARGIPRWLGFALAACVLAAVGAGTFLFSGMLLRQNRSDVAKAPAPDASATVGREDDKVLRIVIAQLQEEPVKKRLADELKTQPSVSVDVPTANNQQAAEQLMLAFHKTGVTVLVDATARAKLANKESQVRYALYVENMTQPEAVQFFQQLAMADQKAGAPKPVDYMLMTDLNAKKRSELAAAMHVDPISLDREGGVTDLPQLIEAPKGKGGNQGAAVKTMPRYAVLLALNGGAGQSPELRRFLEARQKIRPGTVQMVLVIHERTG